jgi:hypothetical protein
MSEELRTLLKQRFSIVGTATKAYDPNYGPFVRFRTNAWHYKIVETLDGIAIQPENSSARYADYVELLLDCLIELALKHENGGSPYQVTPPISK